MIVPRLTRALSPYGWLAAAIVAVTLLIVGWYILTEPGRASRRAEEARAARVFSEARTAATGEALRILDAATAARAASEQLTQENAHAIHSAPGADQRLDPQLNRVGRQRLCNRAAYRDRPECLQQPDR